MNQTQQEQSSPVLEAVKKATVSELVASSFSAVPVPVQEAPETKLPDPVNPATPTTLTQEPPPIAYKLPGKDGEWYKICSEADGRSVYMRKEAVEERQRKHVEASLENCKLIDARICYESSSSEQIEYRKIKRKVVSLPMSIRCWIGCIVLRLAKWIAGKSKYSETVLSLSLR